MAAGRCAFRSLETERMIACRLGVGEMTLGFFEGNPPIHLGIISSLFDAALIGM
jgi:hypothetical protein